MRSMTLTWICCILQKHKMIITLTTIAKRHDEWIAIARYCGAPGHLAEDLVQDLYIKLHSIQEREGDLQRLEYRDDLNTAYIFMALRNLVVSHYRKQDKRTSYIDDLEGFEPGFDEEPNHKFEEVFEELIGKVSRLLEDMHWYDAKVMQVYVDEGHSIRSMSRATGISEKSIFNTLKNVKTTIKEKCWEDYEDYSQEKGIKRPWRYDREGN